MRLNTLPILSLALLFAVGCPSKDDSADTSAEADADADADTDADADADADTDTDADADSDADADFLPQEGLWQILPGEMIDGDCDLEASEEIPMNITEVETTTFTFSPIGEDFSWFCSFDAGNFDCPDIVTEVESDARTTYEMIFGWNGVFSDSTNLSGRLHILFTCEGDCKGMEICEGNLAVTGIAGS